jgi:hypothetical protein
MKQGTQKGLGATESGLRLSDYPLGSRQSRAAARALLGARRRAQGDTNWRMARRRRWDAHAHQLPAYRDDEAERIVSERTEQPAAIYDSENESLISARKCYVQLSTVAIP